MAENQIRLSQLIGYYGPGAMLDLPDRSVLVMGLDHWDQRSGAFRLIEEPRLSRLLRLRLQDDSRLATTGDPQLRTPPLDVRDPRQGIAQDQSNCLSALVRVRRGTGRPVGSAAARALSATGSSEAARLSAAMTVSGGAFRLSVSFADARSAIFKTLIGVAWFTKTHSAAKVVRSQSGSRTVARQAILDRHGSIVNAERRYRSMICFSRVGWANVEQSGRGSMVAAIRTAVATCFDC